MMSTLTSPLEQVYETIEHYFRKELIQEGILSDVNTFLTSANNKEHIDAPVIWIEKETITPTHHSYTDESLIDVPVNIICCAEIIDDFQGAENDSMNLASRCITSLFHNITQPRQVGQHVNIRGFTINNIDPNGTFEIINKTTLLPATRMTITFNVGINWMLYQEDDGTTHTFTQEEPLLEEILFDDIH